nr:ATP-binding protein [Thiorhodococcus minor]
MNLSLFDSASNYNACIAAQSGAGKSFLTNELISTTLSVGGRCWVIDVGRSYEKLCEALDVQFLAFTREARICLNPFELVVHWDEEADMIAALVGAMIAPSGGLDDYARSGLKRVLKTLWDAEGRAMTVDGIAAALSAESDPRLQDLGTQLYPFTTQGEYGRLFNGPNSIAFSAPFVVLELEELKGRKHLQQAVLLQLIYQIQQAMYLGERDQAKLVILDEAWDLLSQGDVARFIETGYRRFRKYRGAAVTVTQSLNDLYAHPTGRAIAESSAHTFLLAQPAQAIDHGLPSGSRSASDRAATMRRGSRGRAGSECRSRTGGTTAYVGWDSWPMSAGASDGPSLAGAQLPELAGIRVLSLAPAPYP